MKIYQRCHFLRILWIPSEEADGLIKEISSEIEATHST